MTLENFNRFLETYSVYIVIAIVCLIVVILITFLLLKAKSSKGQTNSINEITHYKLTDEVLKIIGGEDNFENITIKGSRVEVLVKTTQDINIEELNEKNLKVVLMSNKITFLINNVDRDKQYKILFK